ncbi:helix-turn-helix transcriptional regulator [Ectobacillus sp. JY-23]|uniref:helix-turn-helix transcriptional regulator n=1 Tax=Ectobacillus sp. JY-23 TaxID=2933872 RepID=UPI001FF12F17|nr:helix-turn-helix transcriptional regulator [Ectobacillus sp. JY-23]UOY92873.1 helix-turn-helix transcriptional regulator [Ectobacillus sp. JY-23]
MIKKRFKLIQLRKDANLFQKDVVYRLESQYGISITESYYGMIEQGVRTPSLEIALAISKVFDKSPEYIFFGD